MSDEKDENPLLAAAKEMISFILGFNRTKADSWPDEKDVKRWQKAIDEEED